LVILLLILTLLEKLCLLFERMELSDGFLNIEKKTSKTHNKKTSVILPKEISDKVKFMIYDKKDNLINVSCLFLSIHRLNLAKKAKRVIYPTSKTHAKIQTI